jgi:hypothetical protein
MKITEIQAANSGGWEHIDFGNRVSSLLWDQVPQYYRGASGVWALNPNKTTTPLMAILGSYTKVIVKIINAEHFSKGYVTSKLTELVHIIDRATVAPRSGHVWHNNMVRPFFDVYSFPKVAPAGESKFWYDIPMAQDIFGEEYSSQRAEADKCYAILPKTAFESAEKMIHAVYSSYKVFTKNNRIVSIPSNPQQTSLQNLVDALSLGDSNTRHGSIWVVHNGQVTDIQQAAFLDPQPSLSDGTKIWRVPSWALPSIGPIHFEKTWKTADSAFLALLPNASGATLSHTVLVGVRKGKLLGLGRGHNNSATEAQLVDLSKLLASEMNIGGGKEKMIEPNSNFHKMLSYVAANPGGPRSGWFSRGLGLSLQGMPAIWSPKAQDGLASRLGLVTLREPSDPPSKYRITLTPSGRLVLARLNAGKSIGLNTLVSMSTPAK